MCKSLQIHGDVLHISKGAHLWTWECSVLPARRQTRQDTRHLCHQGKVFASHPSSISDHDVRKTNLGLHLPLVPTKTWCSPFPSRTSADLDQQLGASFFPSFIMKSWKEHYQGMRTKRNQRNGKSLSRASTPGCCFL